MPIRLRNSYKSPAKSNRSFISNVFCNVCRNTSTKTDVSSSGKYEVYGVLTMGLCIPRIPLDLAAPSGVHGRLECGQCTSGMILFPSLFFWVAGSKWSSRLIDHNLFVSCAVHSADQLLMRSLFT